MKEGLEYNDLQPVQGPDLSLPMQRPGRDEGGWSSGFDCRKGVVTERPEREAYMWVTRVSETLGFFGFHGWNAADGHRVPVGVPRRGEGAREVRSPS